MINNLASLIYEAMEMTNNQQRIEASINEANNSLEKLRRGDLLLDDILKRQKKGEDVSFDFNVLNLLFLSKKEAREQQGLERINKGALGPLSSDFCSCCGSSVCVHLYKESDLVPNPSDNPI